MKTRTPQTGPYEVADRCSCREQGGRSPARGEQLGVPRSGRRRPPHGEAQHGRGTGDLLDEIVSRLGEERPIEEVADADDDGALRVAIVGRPNVGKSTLFNNSSARSARSCTTCRAPRATPFDTLVQTDVGLIRFIDTAGMRRRAKTEGGTRNLRGVA